MDASLSFVAAISLGLFGSVHCVGMCGGISGALGFALGPDQSGIKRIGLLLLANLGRLFSYGLMGAVAGGFSGSLLQPDPTAMGILRGMAAALLVLMGLYLAGWSQALGWLERMGYRVWSRLRGPQTGGLRINGPFSALMVGAGWGWLPCGLVYSTLAWATTSASVAAGATLMCGFGLGTLPAVMAGSLFADRLRRILQRRELRVLVGLSVIAFGIWTLLPVVGGGGHHGHH